MHLIVLPACSALIHDVTTVALCKRQAQPGKDKDGKESKSPTSTAGADHLWPGFLADKVAPLLLTRVEGVLHFVHFVSFFLDCGELTV